MIMFCENVLGMRMASALVVLVLSAHMFHK